MKEILDAELARYGIHTQHSIMDNGERRFRLSGRDGSCYIRAEAAQEGGWQNSHLHTRLSELCVVQTGWVVYAELHHGQVTAARYRAGESWIIRPMVAHNTYMSPGSVQHTVKFGDCSDPDWIPSPELDLLIRENDPVQIL